MTYHLLAPQSEQTRHNKSGYYFQRRIPAVWEHSRVRQLYRNTFMTAFTQAFQIDQNNIDAVVGNAANEKWSKLTYCTVQSERIGDFVENILSLLVSNVVSSAASAEL